MGTLYFYAAFFTALVLIAVISADNGDQLKWKGWGGIRMALGCVFFTAVWPVFWLLVIAGLIGNLNDR